MCHNVKALNLTLLARSADDAFVSTGFNDWKHTIACYRKHEMSSAHVESCLKWNQHVKGVSVDVQLSVRRVLCARGHSVQPSPNAFGLLLLHRHAFHRR